MNSRVPEGEEKMVGEKWRLPVREKVVRLGQGHKHTAKCSRKNLNKQGKN